MRVWSGSQAFGILIVISVLSTWDSEEQLFASGVFTHKCRILSKFWTEADCYVKGAIFIGILKGQTSTILPLFYPFITVILTIELA